MNKIERSLSRCKLWIKKAKVDPYWIKAAHAELTLLTQWKKNQRNHFQRDNCPWKCGRWCRPSGIGENQCSAENCPFI